MGKSAGTRASSISHKTLDELLFELGYRLQQGESVDLDQYERPFPDQADKFDKAYQAMLLLTQWTDAEFERESC